MTDFAGGSAGGSATGPGAAPLPAPPPGWTIDADVVVVGSGVAGLTAALRCAAAGRRTVVVTKARLDDGSTRWAQGGIAAALGEGDTPEQHLADTLVAGAGLCDEEAVRTLVTEGPAAVRRLIAAGARFDTEAGTGEVALTREGGHRRRRIAHAGGDATGAEISRALVTAVRRRAPRAQPHREAAPAPEGSEADAVPAGGGPAASAAPVRARGWIRTVENALVLDLVKTPDGAAAGVTLHVMGEGRHDGVGAVNAPAVVLATGGMGQVFSATTNPAVSTGDGVALALRAGAEVSDLEFVQFHPTVLYLGPGAEGRQPLISEAVRGEGAHLVDGDGVRFMQGLHELAELAPRDIVAKAITRRAAEQGTEHAYVDARHFGARMWEERFPTILAACREHGIDPVTRLVPIAPAAHYASGGVRTDLHGRTTVPGLYACGEVACTGVHGANRLASNSLLEGLVFAERIAAHIAARPDPSTHPSRAAKPEADAEGDAEGEAVQGPAAARTERVTAGPLLPAEARAAVQRIMTRCAGVLRSEAGLAEAAALLDALPGTLSEDAAHTPPVPGVETWETANLHLVARVLVAAALRRTETRGCHWREDRPERDDAAFGRHLVVALRTVGRTLDAGGPAERGPAAAPDEPDESDAPPERGGRTALDIRTTPTTAFPRP